MVDSPAPPPHTAALVVIGNEILSGKIPDENGPFLLRELRSLGVETRRVEVVPDEVDLIADALQRCRRAARHLFTSGGVGATHDDVTIAAVARALGRPVVRHPEIEALLRGYLGGELDAAALRLCEVPEGAELVWSGPRSMRYPALLVCDILVLPGVPRFFAEKFEAVKERYRAPPIRLVNLFLSVGEPTLAPALTRTAEEFPDVALGSYPRFDAADHRVKITVESRDPARVEQCLALLRSRFEAGWILREEEG